MLNAENGNNVVPINVIEFENNVLSYPTYIRASTYRIVGIMESGWPC